MFDIVARHFSDPVHHLKHPRDDPLQEILLPRQCLRKARCASTGPEDPMASGRTWFVLSRAKRSSVTLAADRASNVHEPQT